jgi:RNA polymerase sigma-70 factor (ECF subfamily)
LNATWGSDVTERVEADVRELVMRARTREPEAWEQLYRRSYSRLFAYARRRVSSDGTADDVVSETMLRALHRIDTFTWRGAGFDAWLFGILRNVVRESHRHRARLVSVAEPPETAEPGSCDALGAIIEATNRSLMRDAFARLTPEDQELLELRVVAGLTAEGAGEILGRRPGAVRMAQSRALGRLRVLYEGATDAR